jgi:hypothetical protein
VLRQKSDPHIRVFTVWEPILATDYSSPGNGVLARLSDPRVAQYWDKNHLFAEQLARRLKSDPEHPRPHCCNSDGIDWDEVAVYRQDANWDDQLPRAAFLDGPVVHALGLANVVAELLSKARDSEPRSLLSSIAVRHPLRPLADTLFYFVEPAGFCVPAKTLPLDLRQRLLVLRASGLADNAHHVSCGATQVADLGLANCVGVAIFG